MPTHRRLAGLLALLALLACGPVTLPAPATLPPAATWTPAPLLPTPTFAPPPTASPQPPVDSGWETLQPGLERRRLRILGESGQLREQVTMVRVDPAYFRFDVAYRPGAPLALAAWQQETGALLLVNGGYFTETYAATGLIVIGGEPAGSSYGEFAGMLAITAAGPELRWLAEQPYDPEEPLLAGLQSFPILVRPDGAPAYPDDGGPPSRRTVIGQDRQGRILFLIAPYGSFSLHALSQFLAAGDLDLRLAINLDGGTSSGMLLADPAESIAPFVPLPAVIAVYPNS